MHGGARKVVAWLTRAASARPGYVAASGVLACLGVVVFRAAKGPGDGLLYFPDAMVSIVVLVWVALGVLRALWDGSAQEPRTAAWADRKSGTRAGRATTAARQWFRGALLFAAVSVGASWLLHVPLGLLDLAVVGIALAATAQSFDLVGWAVARFPAGIRRAVHILLLACLVGSAAVWVWNSVQAGILPHRPEAALLHLVGSSYWGYLLPAGWILGLVEGLVNGQPPFLLYVAGPFGLLAALTSMYVFVGPRPASRHLPAPQVRSDGAP